MGNVKVGQHVKLKYYQRAVEVDDPRRRKKIQSKSVESVWRDAIPCEIDTYNCRKARYDPVGDVVLILRGDKVRTLVNRYSHTDVELKELRQCPDCTHKRKGVGKCEHCGSDSLPEM